MIQHQAIHRALISVSDKTGIVELATALVASNVEIVATGGTAALLTASGIPVTAIEQLTNFPEMLDGRVKTLHPVVYAGILARREVPTHVAALAEHGIGTIDLVVVNLYPFRETVARPGTTFDEAIEQVDIGGPSMLRAAAKNHADVVVLVDAADYASVAATIARDGKFASRERQEFALKAFRHTAGYDAAISQYMATQLGESDTFPDEFVSAYGKIADLRYGENPHQQAAFYRAQDADASTIAGARQLHGKQLSYNNIVDADAALAIVREFDRPAVVAVKHTNPCGVGLGDDVERAWTAAYEADPLSIFGGVVACNRVVDEATAERMSAIFLEIIIAPGFSDEALAVLTRKPALRLLEVVIPRGDLETEAVGANANANSNASGGSATALLAPTAVVSQPAPVAAATPAVRSVNYVRGGLLVQDVDTAPAAAAELTVVSKRQPSADELAQLRFAWSVVRHVRSNAIVIARDDHTVGIGAGQMNRVGSVRIALDQAGPLAAGAALASDAFFPMPDSIEVAAAAGISAIIQPGGSKRDADIIAAADAAGMALVFTTTRHFRH